MTNDTLASQFRRFLLMLSRFITALCLALWIGGLAFFGIMAAPVLFHPERSGIARTSDTATLAPQMVSAMLTRFGTLTTLCAVLLILCALADGALSRALKSQIWRAQIILCVLCLGFSGYLSGVLLPRTRVEQRQILPLIARASRGETLSPAETTRRADFDSGHRNYQRLSSLNLLVLLAILWLLLARGDGALKTVVPKNASKP